MGRELSAETLELILNKVKDINRFGMAFHTVGANGTTELNTVGDILKDGILGLSTEFRYSRNDDDFNHREAWKRGLINKSDLPKVWFDILGGFLKSAPTMKECYWLRNAKKPLNTTIIFDLTQYNDPIGTREEYLSQIEKIKKSGSLEPEREFIRQNTQLGNYMPANTGGPTTPCFAYAETRSGKSRGGWDSGYVLFGKIPPRFFNGIVIQPFNEATNKEETSFRTLQEVANKTAITMQSVYTGEPHLLLPIYDARGSLLWPEHITYEQVVQLVAERVSQLP